MDINKEIKELEKQIESLKKKQEENRAKRRIVNSGDVYYNHNVCCKLLVIHLGYDKWGYTYHDGSGEMFDSKIKLEDVLCKEHFKYIEDKLLF